MTFFIPVWLLWIIAPLGLTALLALGFFSWVGWSLSVAFSKGIWR